MWREHITYLFEGDAAIFEPALIKELAEAVHWTVVVASCFHNLQIL